jgi:NADPH:quinone reductase
MKAQVINKFGDCNVFEYVNMPRPKVQQGHVLIKVQYTSVNQIDCKIRSGLVPNIAPDFPAILHGDVAGIIEEIGAGVTHVKVGDEVYGCAGGLKGCSGALAEYMIADASLLALKPKTLSMQESAALPLISITAWEALFTRANLQRGQSVLIHGGVGGVGHIAIQLAKSIGATVYATVTKEQDFPLALALGADYVINSKEEKVEDYVSRLTQGLGFEIIFDTVGGANLNSSFAAAASQGIIVTTAARTSVDLGPMHAKGLSLHVVFMLLPLLTNTKRAEHGHILSQMSALIDAGKVKPCIDKHIFTLETVNDAHQYVELGKARGKVVIKIN